MKTLLFALIIALLPSTILAKECISPVTGKHSEGRIENNFIERLQNNSGREISKDKLLNKEEQHDLSIYLAMRSWPIDANHDVWLLNIPGVDTVTIVMVVDDGCVYAANPIESATLDVIID